MYNRIFQGSAAVQLAVPVLQSNVEQRAQLAITALKSHGMIADTLIGKNFDLFHKNPAHQQNLLGRLQAPHEANIRPGVRRFNLLAAPVFSQQNALMVEEAAGSSDALYQRAEALSVLMKSFDTGSPRA